MKENVADGILVINKPKGMTSHDVVNIVRRLYGIRRVGHAGTLDPIATGVLVILVGPSTSLSNRIMEGDKCYDATLMLGRETDTADSTGRVTATYPHEDIGEDSIKQAFLEFKGEIEQVPPMYSAVKYRGKSLYKYARKGEDVPRKSRKVNISDIAVTDISGAEVTFELCCSKGTYVRQLCADIGAKLGCGAHMTSLRRTRSGDYDISQALDLDRLKESGKEELAASLIHQTGKI